MALGVINCVALGAVRPHRNLGYLGTRRLRALAVCHQVGDRDALELGNPAEPRRSPEGPSWRAEHDDAAVVEQQSAVQKTSKRPFRSAPNNGARTKSGGV